MGRNTDGDAYVLRDRDQDEVARLRFQHEVWREPTDDALDRAGVLPGERWADLGCGPGFLSLDLAARVGGEGRVLAVDASELFVGVTEAEADASGLGSRVEALRGDIRDSALGTLDGAVCRWVLMFVSKPERVLENVAEALRPGGTFVAMEYVQFRSMSLWPSGEAFARTYRAVHRLIEGAGGSADLGGRLPSLFEEHGFEVVDLIPILRVGRPGSPLWEWLARTHVNHTNLVEAGLLSEDELKAYYDEWARAETTPGAFFTAPPFLVTIGRLR